MSCNQPLKPKKLLFWMNNERGGGQAYEMGVARRTDYVVYIKKKIGSYKNLWPKRHLLGFEKNFQQRECSNGKFQRKIFLTRVGEGGPADTRTPLDLLDTDSPILACSRLSDRGEGAKTHEQKKN